MANQRSGNSWYVDTASESLAVSNTRLVSIIFTAASSDSEIVIGDDIATASYPDRISVKAVANTTEHIRLADAPMSFNAGIRIKSITSGAKATLVLTTTGN